MDDVTESFAETAKPYAYACIPCAILSVQVIVLDSFVIKYYWKDRKKFVPMMYLMISVADIVNAVGAIHQAIVSLLYAHGLAFSEALEWNFFICYATTSLSYRTSVFYNLVLAVSRTMYMMNISTPGYRIKRKSLVIAACVLYPVIWAGVLAYDIYFFSKEDDIEEVLMDDVLRAPLPGYGLLSDEANTDEANIVYAVVFFVLPCVIPTLVVVVACIMQIVSLWKSSTVNVGATNTHRPVTVTILMISVLFVICNFVYTVYYTLCITEAVDFGDYSTLCGALFGTLLPILNAAFSPVIIIFRNNGTRNEFLNLLRRIGTRGTRVEHDIRLESVVQSVQSTENL